MELYLILEIDEDCSTKFPGFGWICPINAKCTDQDDGGKLCKCKDGYYPNEDKTVCFSEKPVGK